MTTQNELVKLLFSYLDYTEESNSGTEFHSVKVTCCRSLLTEKVEWCLMALKESIE